MNKMWFLPILALMICTVPVSAIFTNSAAPVYIEPSLVTGTAEFIVLAGGSALNTTVYVRNNEDMLDSVGRPFILNPSGTLSERFIPGNFTATLFDGNGGRTEIQPFRIEVGYNTRVVFLGHAVSNVQARETVPIITPGTPDTCYPVQFDYYDDISSITFHFNNPNRDPKLVHVYGWVEPLSYIVPHGDHSYSVQTGYSLCHGPYQFTTETICEEI